MADLYRKSSLDKLSNPEQLDKMIKISSPLSWLALIAVFLIIAATIIWSFVGSLPTIETVDGIIIESNNVQAVYSPTAGVLGDYAKDVGDKVKKGEKIVDVKLSDNSTISIVAPCDGILTVKTTDAEESVLSGSEIVRLTPDNLGSQVVVCYVSLSSAQKFNIGDEVLVYPTSIDSQKYGHMVAEIVSVDEYATQTESLSYVFGSGNSIAEQFYSNGPIVAIVCKLKTDVATKSGFYWSSDNAKNLTVSNDTMVSAKIVVDESKPISKLFGKFKDSSEG